MKTIPLTQGKVALVDDADFDAVNAFKWRAHKCEKAFYAVRSIPGGIQYLHQFLLPDAKQVDHRDGDGLNNQRNNLRPSTQLQNRQGFQQKRVNATSKFRGVSWNSARRKWEAQIQVDGQKLHLGAFTFEDNAADAYNHAASKYFGEFAQLNVL